MTQHANRGLAALDGEKFTPVASVGPGTTHAITGDKHGGLWLSQWVSSKNYGLVHLADGKISHLHGAMRVGGPCG